MLDSNFYRQVGEEGIARLYSGELTADEILHVVEGARSDLPHVDQLETTNNCNMRCIMCPRTEHMTRGIVKSMSDHIFRVAIDELAEVEAEKKARGVDIEKFRADPPASLIWSGSEHDIFDLRLHHFGAPLLDPKMIDRVAYIQEKGAFGAQMSETVVNLKIDKVRELFRYGLNRLIIAIDGIDADSFASIRGRKVNFRRHVVERVKDVLRVKEEMGADTRVEVQVIDLKGTSMVEFERMWHEEGVDVLQKSFFPYPDIPDSVGYASKEFSADCLLPFTSMVVMADGRVVPCCADYNGEEVIGHVQEESLAAIWSGARFREFREKFVRASFEEDSLCRRCGAYPFSEVE